MKRLIGFLPAFLNKFAVLLCAAAVFVSFMPGAKAMSSVRICAVGDVMTHLPQINGAYDSETGTYDFCPWFSYIKQALSYGDVRLCNLETVLAGDKVKYSGYPRFNAPDTLLDGLRYAGFDVITTANNHCLDKGAAGALRTIEKIREAGFKQTGTFLSVEDSRDILMLQVKDINIAVLAYSTGYNGSDRTLKNDQKFLIKPLSAGGLSQIRADIELARNRGADFIVACVHWGIEYSSIPGSRVEKLADQLLYEGVDVILGSHPHAVQGCDRRTVTNRFGESKEVFVAYSMGNFISNQVSSKNAASKFKDAGVIFYVTFQKESGIKKLGNISYMPVWVKKIRYSSNKGRYWVVAPGQYVLTGSDPCPQLTANDRKRMTKVYYEMIRRIGKDADLLPY